MRVLATRVGFKDEDVWQYVADDWDDLANVEDVLALDQCRYCGSGGPRAAAAWYTFDEGTVLHEEDGQVLTGYRLVTVDHGRAGKRTYVRCGYCGARSGIHWRDEELVTF